MTDVNPTPPPTPQGNDAPTDEFDYLIDPLEGLPRLADDEPAEPAVRIGRKPVQDDDDSDPDDQTIIYRASSSDPLFGYVVAMAVSVGLMPLLPDGAPMRYTVSWGVLAAFGLVAWLLGNGERIGQERPEDLFWGGMMGVLAGTPLYLFGGATLTTTAQILFGTLPSGALLAYLLFVMPLGETLFFRGLLQANRSFWWVSGMATVWSGLLFFPLIRNLSEFWAVAVFIGVTLAIVNTVYSWVRERNGLAAAWVCQVVVNLTLIYLPFISRP